MKKTYRVYEGLRIALSLTFMSGYLNTFTYLTQEGRFAGVQSGNVIYLAYHLALGNFYQAFSFLVPIIFFCLGQWFTYLMKRAFIERKWPWHFSSSLVITGLLLLDCLLTHLFPPLFTIAILAFAASIQVESFRHLRGHPYANVMMTGNVKNASYLWFKGVMEKNTTTLKQGLAIFYTILSFICGVMVSTQLSTRFNEAALYFLLVPALFINYQLWMEKRKEPSK